MWVFFINGSRKLSGSPTGSPTGQSVNLLTKSNLLAKNPTSWSTGRLSDELYVKASLSCRGILLSEQAPSFVFRDTYTVVYSVLSS